MDRTEAVTYLKELLSLCNELSPESVSLQNPKNSDSIGYCVHIRGTIPESDRETVRDIAKKHNLVVKEDTGGVVVYKLK